MTCADREAYVATILAALRFYQASGQGDPGNRSDEIHEIATCGDEVISLDDEGIDDLCHALNFGVIDLVATTSGTVDSAVDAAIEFDTSGAVDIAPPGPPRPGCIQTVWADLDPFTQGYVEALLSDVNAADEAIPRSRSRFDRPFGFSALAPETLARIMEDCERFRATWTDFTPDVSSGNSFWNVRQRGSDIRVRNFPPQCAHLGDDAQIYLRGR